MLTEGEAKDVLSGLRHSHCGDRAGQRCRRRRARAAAELLKSNRACVVKVQSDDISHKSDVGGVRLGLTTADEGHAKPRVPSVRISRVLHSRRCSKASSSSP